MAFGLRRQRIFSNGSELFHEHSESCLPESLHNGLKEMSRRDGVSINQFITTAVAEKLSALLTKEYLDERARRGDRDRFESVLARIVDAQPDSVDCLEEPRRRRGK